MIVNDRMILISLCFQTNPLTAISLNYTNYLQTSKLLTEWAEEIKSSLLQSLARGPQVVNNRAKHELDDNY